MGLVEEIARLQELHKDGALTDQEFAQAKAAVLAAPAGRPAPVSGAQGVADSHSGPVLEQIRDQNELARLDREWELEREKYMISGRYGSRHLPNAGGSILGGVLLGGFGVFWTATAASGGAPAFFVLFGCIFVMLAVGMGITGVVKAAGYREAYARYQQRRAKLLAQGDWTDVDNPHDARSPWS